MFLFSTDIVSCDEIYLMGLLYCCSQTTHYLIHSLSIDKPCIKRCVVVMSCVVCQLIICQLLTRLVSVPHVGTRGRCGSLERMKYSYQLTSFVPVIN